MRKSTAAHPFELTEQQHAVWAEMSETGLAGKQLARHLGLEANTINSHLKQIYLKLEVDTAVKAVVLYHKRKQDARQS